MELILNLRKFSFGLLALAVALSFFVYIEPAPYELLLFSVLLTLSLKFLQEGFTLSVGFRNDILLFFLVYFLSWPGNFLSPHAPKSIAYHVVTLLLASAIFVINLLKPSVRQIQNYVLIPYILATSINTIAIILKFVGVDLGQQSMELRPMGYFKDPNVMSAFCVPGAVFGLYLLHLGATSWKRSFLILGVFLSSLAVITSLSRAAILNLLISIAVYVAFSNHARISVYVKAGLISLLIILLAGASLGINLDNLTDYFSNAQILADRLKYQNYDDDRFGGQKLILTNLNLLGHGGYSADTFVGMSPHSLYVRALYEFGLLAALPFFAILSILLWQVLRTAIRNRGSQDTLHDLSAVVAGVLVGLLVSSFVIDSIHWRHFWLILALSVYVKNHSESHYSTKLTESVAVF